MFDMFTCILQESVRKLPLFRAMSRCLGAFVQLAPEGRAERAFVGSDPPSGLRLEARPRAPQRAHVPNGDVSLS